MLRERRGRKQGVAALRGAAPLRARQGSPACRSPARFQAGPGPAHAALPAPPRQPLPCCAPFLALPLPLAPLPLPPPISQASSSSSAAAAAGGRLVRADSSARVRKPQHTAMAGGRQVPVATHARHSHTPASQPARAAREATGRVQHALLTLLGQRLEALQRARQVLLLLLRRRLGRRHVPASVAGRRQGRRLVEATHKHAAECTACPRRLDAGLSLSAAPAGTPTSAAHFLRYAPSWSHSVISRSKGSGACSARRAAGRAGDGVARRCVRRCRQPGCSTAHARSRLPACFPGLQRRSSRHGAAAPARPHTSTSATHSTRARTRALGVALRLLLQVLLLPLLAVLLWIRESREQGCCEQQQRRVECLAYPSCRCLRSSCGGMRGHASSIAVSAVRPGDLHACGL